MTDCAPYPELDLLPLALADVPPALRAALAQEGVPAVELATAGQDSKFVVFDSSQRAAPALQPGQTAIDVGEWRDWPAGDPFELLQNCQSQPRAWRVGRLTPSEWVAVVDKRLVRQQLMDRLRDRLEAAGGVWLRLSAYPAPYRSAFNLRVDYDQYAPQDFVAFWQTIEGHETSVSHFVCAKAVLPQPRLLHRLRGCDVGSHGFYHHTYRDERENRENVERGIAALQSWGLPPVGFAAPHGRWSPELGRILDRLGVSHSSEFALAYDDWPSTPPNGQTLQIPVHPLGLGVLLEAAQQTAPELSEPAVAEIAAEHWRRTALAKYAAGEPMFFYDHPDGRLGRHPDVVRTLLDAAAGCGALWRTTLSQMARWWRARQQVRLRVRRQADSIVVRVERHAPGHRAAIEFWHGRQVAVLPLDGEELRFSPAALAYQTRAPLPNEKSLRIAPPRGLRHRLRTYLDWELETPVAEISTATWRGWFKRRLRQSRTAQEVRG